MIGRGVVRAASRAALGAVFVIAGADALAEPGARAQMAEDLGVPYPDAATRLNGGIMVVAGAALALGMAPKRAAVMLAGALVPTTLAGHAYWHDSEPAARSRQRIQFYKNLGLFGGLLGVLLDDA